ncbi:MAG: HXXEE domain-containing protein [Methanobacterium sp.]|nr:HXXEE domain-containing protein [Methanobacterium sp.]
MDLTILWLVPVAYFIHIFEETPRFVPWAIKYLGAPETFGQFLVGNVIFMAYVIIATSLAIFYPSELTLVIGLSAAAWIFSNFLIHAYYTLSTGEYSPGVVTASAIYVPVSLYIYYNFLVSGMLNNVDLVLSIIIGFAVMYVPTLIQQKRKGKR